MRKISNGDILQRFQTGGADQLAFIVRDVVAIFAEDTGRGVLFQNDSVTVDIDLQGILGADVKNVADFLGENDSAE